MKEIENMLFDFVDVYNQIKLNDDALKAQRKYQKFKNDLQVIIEQDIDYLSILDKEFENDSQLYILVLSFIFFCSKDIKNLEKIKQLLFLDDLPMDVSLRILKQININHFFNGFAPSEYSQERKLHLHMLQRLKKELNMVEEYIPYEERNHNVIIIETDTLLSNSHAPSKMVLDMYKRLKYELGYEVYLLVNVLRVEDYNMEDYWVLPYRINYLPKYNGEFIRLHEDIEICGFQQVINENDLMSIHKSIEYVYSKKPEFVWHIGGHSVISDLLKDITTLVSMHCTDGYAISEAPILVSYMKNSSGVKEAECFIEEKGQKTIDISLTAKFEMSDMVYYPEDFGFSKDNFIIAIVGTRLDTEIDEQFISIMEKIAINEENVRFVTVGKCSKKWDNGVLRGRVVNLGYCKDLANVLKATHLFLNPVRLGGGGGAYCSIIAEVPIITLAGCDVANVGEEFVCNSLEEYPQLVSKYCHDEKFYQSQVETCRSQYKVLFEIDHASQCKKVIEQTQKYIADLSE